MALHVASEPELRQLAAELARAGLPRRLVIEADAPYTGQAMAIGIEPTDRQRLKRFLSRYPLVK